MTIEPQFHSVVRGQVEAFQKCTQHGEKKGHEWVAIHDLDEFWFSPMRFTVKDYARYIMEEQPNTTVVHAHQFRYGPKGQDGPVVLPNLIIEGQVWRAPSGSLGEKEAGTSISTYLT